MTERNGARPAPDGAPPSATPDAAPDAAPDAEETARAARGIAAQRRPGGGPPWANLGVPMEKASSFGPSARRLLGRLVPERLGVVVVLVLGVVSVALNVVGPVVLGRATDLIFAGVLGRRQALGERFRGRGEVFLGLEERVLLEHLLDFLVELERRQLEEPDRLLQLRRERQMLRETELEGRLHRPAYIRKFSPR